MRRPWGFISQNSRARPPPVACVDVLAALYPVSGDAFERASVALDQPLPASAGADSGDGALSPPFCQGSMTYVSLIDADELPVEPLEALRQVARSEAELDELRWNQIAAARDAGASWAAIGEALGVSRQSAWEYFTRRVRDDLTASVAHSGLTEGEAMELAVEEVRASRRGHSA